MSASCALCPGSGTRDRSKTQTPALNAPRNYNSYAAPVDPETVLVRGGRNTSLLNTMTLGNGYLGSCIDEERSEMRYLVVNCRIP
ncbi:hypothetical protein SESBI_43574 [Sesbania bispinosa]|nr:hypothetical protein SESBI_43574 [Sesbania bispinosa]